MKNLPRKKPIIFSTLSNTCSTKIFNLAVDSFSGGEEIWKENLHKCWHAAFLLIIYFQVWNKHFSTHKGKQCCSMPHTLKSITSHLCIEKQKIL